MPARPSTRKKTTPVVAPKPEAPAAPAPAPAEASGAAPASAPRRVRRRKPKYFLAMAGNIGAGKTTAAKLISQRLGFELFDEPVIDNRFLREYYADMKRWSFTLQLEFLIRRVEHHELIHTVAKSCVQDRTLYEDPEIFAKYLHGLGNMDNRELDLYYEYFERLNARLPKPDRIICFEVPDVQVLLRRIRERGRAEERGIGVEFLRGLNGYYSTFPQVVQRKYGISCMTVNVSSFDLRDSRGCDEFLDRVTTFLRS
jgi:deoxyadenosine/deoxycytidine kinase